MKTWQSKTFVPLCASSLALSLVFSALAARQTLALNSAGKKSQPAAATIPGPGGSTYGAKANTVALPEQILKTGINLDNNLISANSRQLADSIQLTPVLEKIQTLQEQKRQASGPVTLENLALRQDLNETITEAVQLLQKASLEVDFVMSEIQAEQNVYEEILNSYQNARDNLVAKTNATSFITNGALWAVAEGLDIPTFKYSRLAISSGTTGIIAGVIPSIFSLWAMRQQQGKKTLSETAPNVLAKLFDYPITPDIDYPSSVWRFLQSAPPGDSSERTRREQLIDRWLTDKNLPDFTDPKSRRQLDVITASVSHRKGLTINSLNTRLVMLQQLGGEVMKMKRMLLELSMVTRGEKTI